MDTNLRYAILEALKTEKQFSFDKEIFFEKILKKKYKDSASYNYEPYEPIEKYFQSIDINKYSLEKVKCLTWSSSSSIVFDIFGQYDGEDDYFNIKSLDGIEICPNIERINIQYVWSVKDMSSLINLKKIKDITVFSTKLEVNSLKPILELLLLESVCLEGLVFKDQNETNSVISELKRRGVDVKIK